MFTSEVPSGPAHTGVPARPNNGEKVTPPQVSQAPPTQAVVPSKAAPPVQETPQGESLRARADEVQDAVDNLNEFVESDFSVSHTGIHFSVDKEAEQLVVKMIDRETEAVVRQYPAEEVLDRIKLSQDLKGLLFDAQS